MHNGVIGGFDGFRKQADMMINDNLYSDRKGATDSEALFLIAMGLGLDKAPIPALEQAVAKLESLSRDSGRAPHFRMAAALSDGKTLYAFRYASDDRAPSLYYRQDENGGWSVVSEPIDTHSRHWRMLPAGHVGVFSENGMIAQPFVPQTPARAA